MLPQIAGDCHEDGLSAVLSAPTVMWQSLVRAHAEAVFVFPGSPLSACTGGNPTSAISVLQSSLCGIQLLNLLYRFLAPHNLEALQLGEGDSF